MLRTFVAILSLVAIAASSVSPRPEAVARRFAQLITTKESAGVVKLFHYPPYADPGALTTDEKSVEELLKTVLRELGTPTTFRGPVDEPLLTYGLSARSGLNSYWADVSLAEASDWYFEVEFPNHGPGFLTAQIFFPEGSDSPKIATAGIALSAERKDSRKTVIDLMILVSRESLEDVPDNFREIIEQHLEPTQFYPVPK